jgi:crossover junction endodeoxyribonuclease RuvC
VAITLGIDPGTARTGYGLVEGVGDLRCLDYGVIETKPGRPMPQRLELLFDELSRLIGRYRPDVVAVEELFFARNVTTALAVGQARGIVLLAAARHGVPVVEYKPAEVKQAVVGYGRAEKAQVQEMVRLALGLERAPSPDDAADALAVALCHAQTASFRELTGDDRGRV